MQGTLEDAFWHSDRTDELINSDIVNPETGRPYTREEHLEWWEHFINLNDELIDDPSLRNPVYYADWPARGKCGTIGGAASVDWEDWHDVVGLLSGTLCPPKTTDWEDDNASTSSLPNLPDPTIVTEEDLAEAVLTEAENTFQAVRSRRNPVAVMNFVDIAKDIGRIFMIQAEANPNDPWLCKITDPGKKNNAHDSRLYVWLGQLLELRRPPESESDKALGLFQWFVVAKGKQVVYTPALRKPHDDPGKEEARKKLGFKDKAEVLQSLPPGVDVEDIESWRYTSEWEFTADQVVVTFDFDATTKKGKDVPELTIPEENRVQAVQRLLNKQTIGMTNPLLDGYEADEGRVKDKELPKKGVANKKRKRGGDDESDRAPTKYTGVKSFFFGGRSSSGREIKLTKKLQDGVAVLN